MTRGRNAPVVKEAPRSAVPAPQSNLRPAAAASPATHVASKAVAPVEGLAVQPTAATPVKAVATLSIAITRPRNGAARMARVPERIRAVSMNAVHQRATVGRMDIAIPRLY